MIIVRDRLVSIMHVNVTLCQIKTSIGKRFPETLLSFDTDRVGLFPHTEEITIAKFWIGKTGAILVKAVTILFARSESYCMDE